MDHPQPVLGVVERIEERIVLHAGQGVERLDAIGEQAGHHRLRRAHAFRHGLSLPWLCRAMVREVPGRHKPPAPPGRAGSAAPRPA